MHKHKPGDMVVIKSWYEMVKQYGMDKDGNINIKPSFVTGMKKYCNKIAIIKKRYGKGLYKLVGLPGWLFSDDMFVNDNQTKYIPVIVESPYKSNDQEIVKRNIAYLHDCFRDCLKRMESPYASHGFFTQFLDENTERDIGIAAGQAWYGHAKRLVVYADYGITDGMYDGIDAAKRINPDIEIIERRLYE